MVFMFVRGLTNSYTRQAICNTAGYILKDTYYVALTYIERFYDQPRLHFWNQL
jgi:hypothetical protein